MTLTAHHLLVNEYNPINHFVKNLLAFYFASNLLPKKFTCTAQLVHIELCTCVHMHWTTMHASQAACLLMCTGPPLLQPNSKQATVHYRAVAQELGTPALFIEKVNQQHYYLISSYLCQCFQKSLHKGLQTHVIDRNSG